MSVKSCTKCLIAKPFQAFSRDKHKPDGLKSRCKACDRLWYEENRAWSIAYAKQWIAQNQEHVKAYRQTAEYKQAHAARENSYRQMFPERYEKIRARILEKNPGYENHKPTLSRLRQKRCCPPWLTKQQEREILDFYNLCKELQWLSNETLSVDHIVPLNGKDVCGLHVPWNLQILPMSLNTKKANKV